VEQTKSETTAILTVVTASAFETIFKTYYKGLYGYACTLIRNEPAAEGIVQQVFLKLWEKKEELSIDVSAKAYLYKSVYNHCLNYIKHQQVKSVHEKYMAKQPVRFAENAEGSVLGKELQQHIQNALDDLPEQCGIIFRMSRFEELKYQEIALRLGLSVKTVEAQMGKALRILRTKLSEYLPLAMVIYLLAT
jgi:RNA polymerase sigma-70 factor, ECF subfamily